MSIDQYTNPLLGVSQVFLSGLSWSLSVLLAKIALNIGLDEITLNAARLAFGVLMLALFLKFVSRIPLRLPLQTVVVLMLLGALDMGLGGLLFFRGLSLLDASLAFLLLFTYPAFIFIGSLLLRREGFSLSRSAALVLAFVGVALVLKVGGLEGRDVWQGVACVMGASVVIAAHFLIAESFLRFHSPSIVAFHIFCGGALGMALVFPFYGGGKEHLLDPHVLGLLVLVALLGNVLSQVLLFKGFRHIGASRASIIDTAQPLVMLLLAWAFLGETLSAVQLIGAALLMSGIAVVQIEAVVDDSKRPLTKTPAKPV